MHIKKSSQVLDTKILVNYIINVFFRDSRGIQTRNLLIRSQMLYSVELGSLSSHHSCFASAKVRTFFESTKFFALFFI